MSGILLMGKADTRLSVLEGNFAAVRGRSHRFEIDKDWEMSWTRRIIIAMLTHCVISLTFLVVGLPQAFTNALVPTVAFILSASTMHGVKKIWKQGVFPERNRNVYCTNFAGGLPSQSMRRADATALLDLSLGAVYMFPRFGEHPKQVHGL